MGRIAFHKLLLIIAGVPLLAMAVFAGTQTYESWSRYGELTRASSLVRLGVAMGRYAAIAMPAEGAATRDYLAGGDKAKLDAQRRITDDLYRAVQQAFAGVPKDAKIEALMREIDAKAEELASLRPKVDAKAVAPTASTAVIIGIAGRGIDAVGAIAALTSDAVLSRRLVALHATLQFADSLMAQRGIGQAVLRDGQVPPPVFLVLAQATTRRAEFGKLFAEFAPPEMVAQYRAFEQGNGRTLQSLRELALKNSGPPASADQVNSWTALSAEMTGVLGKVIAGTADLVSAESERMVSVAWLASALYMAVTIAVAVIVLLVCWMVVRTLRSLLGALARIMEALCNKQLDVTVPSVQRKDEIGVMVRAAENFRANLARVAELEAEQKLAESRAREQRAAEMAKLADKFEREVGNIVDSVSAASTELEAAAGTLTHSAEHAQDLATGVAAASKQASSNVKSVASATNELTSSVQEIGRQVHDSRRIADEAVQQAAKTDARIAQLSQAAGRIGDVVKLITAIAEQTNLLALNATIEAARAGEAGKGFAVVAAEVKTLANQTAKATDEISTQIAGMQAATNESVAAIKEIGATIARVADTASAIAAAVEQQGAATGEISRNVHDAARGTAQVATHIVEVSRGAQETGGSSGRVLASARELAGQSSKLKVEVERFLATVRAA